MSACLFVGALALSGCDSSGGARGSVSSSASVAATISASAADSNSAAVPHCPNFEGGDCVGPLTPGTDYTTTQFDPTTTYRVTRPDWANYEDTPGNFLLVPPGNDLPGVNAGTSDFIGIYTSVAPSRFVGDSSCDTELVEGVAVTPEGMVRWMQRQPALSVTAPKPTNVGGLHGLVVDVSVKPGVRLPSCVDPESGSKVVVFLLFSGTSPSSLDHGVIPEMTMRLYLLTRDHALTAVELDDIDSAPGNLTALSAEVRQITFEP